MQLFGALLLPTLFCTLVAGNLAAWHAARINYPLIFELEVRTMIDYRQFLELPAFLLMLLCWAFWLSMSNFWPGTITPHAWPLAWFVVAVLVIFNPFFGCAQTTSISSKLTHS